MPTHRTQIRVGGDGTIVADAGDALPPAEHEATNTVADRPPPRRRGAPAPGLIARMQAIAADLARVADRDSPAARRCRTRPGLVENPPVRRPGTLR